MSTYTLIIDGAQKELITKALSSFARQFHGQTTDEIDAARLIVKTLAAARGPEIALIKKV